MAPSHNHARTLTQYTILHNMLSLFLNAGRTSFANASAPALSFAARQADVSGAVRSYHKNVVDHYERPRNVGSFEKSDPNVGTGLVGAPACGDVMKLQIKVRCTVTVHVARACSCLCWHPAVHIWHIYSYTVWLALPSSSCSVVVWSPGQNSSQLS